MLSDGTFPFFPEIPEKYSFIHHHKFQEVRAPNYRKFVAGNFISESRIVVSENNFYQFSDFPGTVHGNLRSSCSRFKSFGFFDRMESPLLISKAA